MSVIRHAIPLGLRRLLGDWRSRVGFERRLERATPVLVYQMGKVGSLAVYHALQRQHAGAVGHVHGFHPKHERPEIRRLYRWTFDERRPLNVVSFTREPIARNISAFFQNLERDTGRPNAADELTIEELKAAFLSQYRHHVPLEWFDWKVRQRFGIDVYATPFPEDGIGEYENGHVRLLVVRCELDDATKAAAIARFLRMDRLDLSHEHVGEQKSYSLAYRRFKDEARFPGDYVERMCGSKYFTHFYDAQTIQATRCRWSE